MDESKSEKPNLNKGNINPHDPSLSDETKASKPKKLEDKPFDDFINQDFLPSIKLSLKNNNVDLKNLIFKKDIRPVMGGECWLIYGELTQNRKFWLCFSSDKLTSTKHIAIAEGGEEPSLLESFLIDERKITLPLLISRLLQRLNGQKWLGKN